MGLLSCAKLCPYCWQGWEPANSKFGQVGYAVSRPREATWCTDHREIWYGRALSCATFHPHRERTSVWEPQISQNRSNLRFLAQHTSMNDRCNNRGEIWCGRAFLGFTVPRKFFLHAWAFGDVKILSATGRLCLAFDVLLVPSRRWIFCSIVYSKCVHPLYFSFFFGWLNWKVTILSSSSKFVLGPEKNDLVAITVWPRLLLQFRTATTMTVITRWWRRRNSSSSSSITHLRQVSRTAV